MIAAMELVLILPSALFMTALVVRNLPPPHYDAAQTAQRLVMWYAGRMWTLWVLLLALPLAALVTGCATLLHARQSLAQIRANLATLFVAAATLTAGGILAVVILHMLAN
jgi:hypothetical protein